MRSTMKIGAAVVIVLGFFVVLQIQQLRIQRLMTENAGLRIQHEQSMGLRETNEDLANQLKAAITTPHTNQDELLRLRGQVFRLRQLEQENAQLKSERQQLVLQIPQSQLAVASSQGQVTAVTEVLKKADASPGLNMTDLGPLELQSGEAVHFDLGGGTNCIVTPTALSDGNNMMQIRVGVTNADGSFSELGTSRITARPGQHCSIAVGERMVALAVTLKP